MSASFDHRYRLGSLEILVGEPIGIDDQALPVESTPGRTTRQVAEDIVRRALQRPPCLVSFSGGRDSSAVLALAAHVARRDGLPLPMPITNVFRHDPDSREDDWQQLVIDHLELPDWTRLHWHDEMDVVGPFAQQVVRRLGVVGPFNNHFHLPLFQAAEGGSFLTGIGGDEYFGQSGRWWAQQIRFGGRRPRISQVPRALFSFAPRALRVRVGAISRRGQLPYLTRRGERSLLRAYVAWREAEPAAFDASMLGWWWRSRSMQANLAVKAALAGDVDVVVSHPFADPAFLAAGAAEHGPPGPGLRAAAVGNLVGDLLPGALVNRVTKASFPRAFWTDAAREFASTWDGAGVDEALVDVGRLRAVWAQEVPLPDSYSLMQRCWAAAVGREGGGSGGDDPPELR